MSTIEIVESAQLQTALAKSGLSNPELVEIRDAFQPLFAKAEEIVRKSEAIVVADATHLSEMKAARAARLELKAIRVDAEKSRKALKESALKRGQVIDDAARVIKGFIEPVEDRLLAMEEFAERAEAARKAALKAERDAEVRDAGGDPQYYQTGEMPEADFDALISGLLDRAREAREAAAKAEAGRLAKEKADREERARLQAERDRAVAEREAAEKKAREESAKAKKKADAEKAEIEARAQSEREAREKVEAELAAKKRAEEKAAADAEKARKKAEKAPDVVKVRSVAALVRRIDLPVVKSPEAQAAMAEVAAAQERFAKWIEARAAVLEGGAA